MEISDLIEKKPLPIIANMRIGKYKSYSLLLNSEGEIELLLGERTGENIFCIKTNQILIDALTFGKELAEISFRNLSNRKRPETIPVNYWEAFVAHPWYCKEQIPLLHKWIEKYGFIPLHDIDAPSSDYGSSLSMMLMYLFENLCKCLKAMYEYDVLHNRAVELLSVHDCRLTFVQKANKSFVFRIIDGKLGMEYQPVSLFDLLYDLLFDFLSAFDTEFKPFVCEICKQPSFKRNPKQCYCSKCQKFRYQVSRDKRRRGVISAET